MENPMRSMLLSIVSTLALLMYPLSLSAQNPFSISLDTDGTAGDQAVTSVNTSADQVIAIQIFGTDIQNANGLSVRFEYDASQVTYEGFDAGDAFPSAQALAEEGTNPTFVEIGIVSFGGQATVNTGLVGTARFRTTAAFSGTAIQLVRAELSRGGQFLTAMPNITIALQGAPARANFSLSLDVDSAAGDQAITSANVSADEEIAIQIFGTDIQNANGLSVRFEYDASQVTYEGFDAGDAFPSAQALAEEGTNPTFVEIGIVSFGGQATVNSGLVGTARFRTTTAFSGTAIQLVRAELGRGGQIETATLDVRVELQLQVLTPDFNGDGVVNFADFLLFGGQFGARQGDGKYEVKYDLDSDGAIGFGDFLIFGNSFGKDVSTSGGSSGGSGGSGSGGGSSSGSPDLIVESPSVSNSTLSTGQSFTLRATVRNQGTGASASTTLRYYRSSDATISSGDTEVGMDTIGSLMASSSRAESITLNAPSSAGTYYYGACVGSVSGESSTTNNCSGAVRVTVSGGSSTTIVDIPDANLRAVIADSLGKAHNAPITRAEMATLTRLEARDKVIENLTGLEFATNLRGLLLDDNLISDISPVANLTSLGTLWLPNNLISDISPLVNLTEIWQMSLGYNQISDISGLANMTRLEWLQIQKNTISDVSVLSNLTSLKEIIVRNNLISDVSALSNLTSLTYLELGDNIISDVSALSGMTSLRILSIYDNLISDVSALSNLTNLEGLYLRDNLISDVSALSNLTSLTFLELTRNLISDVSALSNLTNLEKLYLRDNLISDVSALSNLTNLEGLYLWNNLISDVSALSNLTNLERLELHYNLISDVSALSNLTSLTQLGLYNNTISDLSPLVANTGLGSGDEVDVRFNPLSATSLNTHIPALQGRGVDVQFSASKPAVGEREPRLPLTPVEMERFGAGEREDAAYLSRRWMEMREGAISHEVKRTTKTDARDRRRMEMRQEMINRKESLRDKARREDVMNE